VFLHVRGDAGAIAEEAGVTELVQLVVTDGLDG
jgi:hypothetical protein